MTRFETIIKHMKDALNTDYGLSRRLPADFLIGYVWAKMESTSGYMLADARRDVTYILATRGDKFEEH